MDLKIILVAMTMVAMIHCEDCNTELSETSGVIVSGKYGHGINCSWTITAPKGNYVKLEFNKEKFDVISKFMSCSHDYVQVFYDSAIPSPHIQTFCKSFGNKFVPKDAITSTTNVLVIRLISDKFFKNGEGFEAKYTVVDEFGEPIAPEETEGGFDEDDWGEDTTGRLVAGKYGLPMKDEGKNKVEKDWDGKKVPTLGSKSKDSKKKNRKGKKRRGKKEKKSKEERKLERKLQRQKMKALKRKARKAERRRRSKSKA
uniref:uncharacterized protein LOC120333385 isoform X2 n=1 Tax=Styela clava TaxID=7725 RepID=UPI001939346A|nr:uncharacterized protein LOC120333385 isoform X2 [Styela clava]